MTTLPEPSFINRDPATITAEMIAAYETATGKTLYPAQVERLLINGFIYRETLTRIGIQEAAKQNLVAYAAAPMLDYLGELVNCTRLDGETDAAYRARILLAPEAAACGTLTAYKYAALSVSATITNASVSSTAPGVVNVVITTTAADKDALLNQVRTALNADDVRALTDQIIVTGAAA